MDAQIGTTRKPSQRSLRKRSLVLLGLGSIGVVACLWAGLLFDADPDAPGNASSPGDIYQASGLRLPHRGGMARIPGGRFLMGSPAAPDPDVHPPHVVELGLFWLDTTPVTVAQFARFVESTGYTTTAERHGHGLVFDPPSRRWHSVAGADWRHPAGPDSAVVGRENWPVVQVSWYDAVAYSRWAQKRLPTEAEYEYAARGGLHDCDYPWGRGLRDGDRYRANAWQGRFPDFDLQRDGYANLSPADAFPPNRYGLRDIVGNIYSWCSDWYDPDYYARAPREAPTGPDSGGRKVQRGGSWLSAPNHEPLAVWRRRAASPDTTTNHVGFRCATDVPPEVQGDELARRPTGPPR